MDDTCGGFQYTLSSQTAVRSTVMESPAVAAGQGSLQQAGPGPLQSFEHAEVPTAEFRFASAVLAAEGRMVVTTTATAGEESSPVLELRLLSPAGRRLHQPSACPGQARSPRASAAEHHHSAYETPAVAVLPPNLAAASVGRHPPAGPAVAASCAFDEEGGLIYTSTQVELTARDAPQDHDDGDDGEEQEEPGPQQHAAHQTLEFTVMDSGMEAIDHLVALAGVEQAGVARREGGGDHDRTMVEGTALDAGGTMVDMSVIGAGSAAERLPQTRVFGYTSTTLAQLAECRSATGAENGAGPAPEVHFHNAQNGGRVERRMEGECSHEVPQCGPAGFVTRGVEEGDGGAAMEVVGEAAPAADERHEHRPLADEETHSIRDLTAQLVHGMDMDGQCSLGHKETTQSEAEVGMSRAAHESPAQDADHWSHTAINTAHDARRETEPARDGNREPSTSHDLYLMRLEDGAGNAHPSPRENDQADYDRVAAAIDDGAAVYSESVLAAVGTRDVALDAGPCTANGASDVECGSAQAGPVAPQQEVSCLSMGSASVAEGDRIIKSGQESAARLAPSDTTAQRGHCASAQEGQRLGMNELDEICLALPGGWRSGATQSQASQLDRMPSQASTCEEAIELAFPEVSRKGAGGGTQESSLGSHRVEDGTQWTQQSSQYIDLRLPSLTPAGSSPRAADSVGDDGRQGEVGEDVEGQGRSAFSCDIEAPQQPYTALLRTANPRGPHSHADCSGDVHAEENAERPAEKPEESQQASGGQEPLVASAQGAAIAASSAQEKPGDDDAQESEIAVELEVTVKVQREILNEAASAGGHLEQHASRQQVFPQPCRSQRSSLPGARPLGSDGLLPDGGASQLGHRDSVNLRLLTPPASASGDAPHGPTAAASVHAPPFASPAVSQHEDVSLPLRSEKTSRSEAQQESRIFDQLSFQPDDVSVIQLGLPEGPPRERRAGSRRVDGEQRASEALALGSVKHDGEHSGSSRPSSLASPDGHAVEVEQSDGVEEEKNHDPESDAGAERGQEAGQTDRSPGDEVAVPMEVEADKGHGAREEDLEPSAPRVGPTPTPASAQRRRKDDHETAATLENSEDAFPSSSKATPRRSSQVEDEQSSAEIHARRLFNLRYTPAPPCHDDTPAAPRAPRRSSPPAPGSYWEAAGHKDAAYAPTPPPMPSAADNPGPPSESPRSSPPPHEARRSRTEDDNEEVSPCLLSSQVDDHDIPLTSASPRASSGQRSSQSSSPVSASVRRASEAETERDLAAEAEEFFRDDGGGSEAAKPTSKEPTPINALPATEWLGRRLAPVLPADARDSLGSTAVNVGACGDNKTDRIIARAGGAEASKMLTSDKRGKGSAVTGPVDNDGPKHKNAGGRTDADAAPGVATARAAKSNHPPQKSDAALVVAAAAAKSKKESSSASEGDGRCLEEWESTQHHKRAEKRRPFVEAPPSSSSPVQENEAKLATLPSCAAPRAVGADEQQGLGQQLLQRALAALARELEEKERRLSEREVAKTQEYEAKERDLAEKERHLKEWETAKVQEERRLKEWEARLQAVTRQQVSVSLLPAPPVTAAPVLPATEPASRKAAPVGSSAMRGRGLPTPTTKSPSKLQTASGSVKSPTKSAGERHNLRSPLRSGSPKRKQQQQEQHQEQEQPSARRDLNTGPLASGARPRTAGGAPPYDDVLNDVFAFPESIEDMPRIRCQADACGRKVQQGQTSGQIPRNRTHSLFSPKQARGPEGRPMGAAVTARAKDVNGLKLAATDDKNRKRVAQESDEDEDGGAVVSPQAQKLRSASPVNSPTRRQSTSSGAAAKHAVMLTRFGEGSPKQRQQDARVQHPQRQQEQRPKGVKLKTGKPKLKVKTKTRGHDKPKPSIEFNELWPYLSKELSWKWTKGKGHVSYYYLRPGMTVKTGRPGQDYFTSEEDVIKYCVENDLLPEPEEEDDALGDICDEQGLTMEDPMAQDADPRQPSEGHSDEEEEDRGQQVTRHARKSVSFERQKRAADAYDSGNDNFDFANDHVMFGHDEHVSDTDEPPRKMISPSSGRRRKSSPPSPYTAALPAPTIRFSVEDNSGAEDFRSLWRRLVKEGWKYRKGGGMAEPYYVRPGKNRKDGVKDQDWFESACGVQDWYERNVLGRTHDDDDDLNMDQERCGDDAHGGKTGRFAVDHCNSGSKHVHRGSEGKRKARDNGDHEHGAAAKKPCTVDSVSKRSSAPPLGREKVDDNRVGSLRGVDLEESEHGDESQQLTQPQFDIFLHMTDAAGSAEHRGSYKAPIVPSGGRVASGKKASGDLVTPSHQPRGGQGHSHSSKKRQSTGGSTSIHITNRSTRGSIFQGLQFLVTGLTPKSTPTRSYIESRIRMHGGLIMHALEDVKLPSGAADFLSPDIDGEEEDNATLRDVVLVSIPGALRRPKYVWALAVGVPIVYPAWVDHCIQSHTTEKVNCISADSFPEFRLPLGFSFKHDKFMFQPDCLNGRPFDGMSVLLCCQKDTLAKDWVSIFKTAGAYAACLQEVDDSWLEQQSVDFIVADPQWPTSATTLSATKLHAVLRANGDAKLRSVDWAIQCFLHGELLEAKVSPRYFELDWRMEGGDVETRTVLVRDAQSNERYDVGDFVFVLAESGASSSAKASGGGRGSMGGGAGLEERKLFGRVEGVSVAPGRSAVLDVRLLAPTGHHRELTANLSGVVGSPPSNVRVKVERLCGKFILLESEDYRRHAIYASRCDSMYRKAKTFDWDCD